MAVLAESLSFPLGSPQDAPSVELTQIYGSDLVFQNMLALNNGDYLETIGLDNLRRAVIRRLMTRKGSYQYRPDYGVGLPYYVKQKMTITVLSQIKHDIINNLSQDIRIASVSDITLTPTTFNNMSALTVALTIQVKSGLISAPGFRLTLTVN